MFHVVESCNGDTIVFNQTTITIILTATILRHRYLSHNATYFQFAVRKR